MSPVARISAIWFDALVGFSQALARLPGGSSFQGTASAANSLTFKARPHRPHFPCRLCHSTPAFLRRAILLGITANSFAHQGPPVPRMQAQGAHAGWALSAGAEAGAAHIGPFFRRGITVKICVCGTCEWPPPSDGTVPLLCGRRCCCCWRL